MKYETTMKSIPHRVHATGRKCDQSIIKTIATNKSAPSITFKNNASSPQDWVLVFERGKL
jgi:hypothetical protein